MLETEEPEAFGAFSALIGFFVGKYPFDGLEAFPGNVSVLISSSPLEDTRCSVFHPRPAAV